MLNVVAIMGRLVADPELRTTQQGTNVCTFRIACERSYTQKGQQRQADFVDIVAWGKTAEFICKFFQKGSMIAVDGSLQTRHYQGKDGSNRTAVEVVASKYQLCRRKGGRQARCLVLRPADKESSCAEGKRHAYRPAARLHAGHG